ncbi:MAG: RodZ domain-containing protein [Pseudomonadota bacterium]
MNSEHDSSAGELPTQPEPVGVGEMLRLAREQQGLDLAYIGAETRIPMHHLEAIELGAFDSLPSRTYAIGFARSYARAVGLDEFEIADAVRAEIADEDERQSAMVGGMEPGDPAKLPSAGLAWFGAFAALLLAVGVFSFYSTYFSAGVGPASLLAEKDDEAADTGANGLAPGENGETSLAQAQSAPERHGRVIFTALEDDVWVRFYEDGGERLFEAQMASGDTFELPRSAAQPLINTGRPDAFAITIDGQAVPKLAEEPMTLGDTPVSAAALLARASPAVVMTAPPIPD